MISSYYKKIKVQRPFVTVKLIGLIEFCVVLVTIFVLAYIIHFLTISYLDPKKPSSISVAFGFGLVFGGYLMPFLLYIVQTSRKSMARGIEIHLKKANGGVLLKEYSGKAIFTCSDVRFESANGTSAHPWLHLAAFSDQRDYFFFRFQSGEVIGLQKAFLSDLECRALASWVERHATMAARAAK